MIKRNKLGRFIKGTHPRNVFKKGYIPWNKGIKTGFAYFRGKKLSKKHREKISLSNQGHLVSKETRKKISIANTGKHLTEKTKQKLAKIAKIQMIKQWKDKAFREKMSKCLKGLPAGDKHPLWKGGKSLHGNGYIYILRPKHPFATKSGHIFEHRLVMERHLKRFLTSQEVVHHKGIKYPLGSIENKQDNRIKNLKLFVNDIEHRKFHQECSKIKSLPVNASSAEEFKTFTV